MAHFVTVDGNGAVLAFYNSSLSAVAVPSGAVAITNTQWQAWSANPGGFRLVSGIPVAYTPSPPSPTPRQQAGAALRAGCAIVSTGTPALSGTYSLADQAVADLQFAAGVIAAGGNAFPSGITSIAWKDASGATHTFTTAAEFLIFAAAVQAYTASCRAFGLGLAAALPAQPVTIA